jgi:hypothetical protein
MAPSNDYLLDETVRERLAAHDRRLIKGSTSWFPGEEPEVHWDFNRAREFELLTAYLDGFTDLAYRDGEVTVEGAAEATYGTGDDYLKGRISGTHLNPASGFNKGLANGEVVMVGPDGERIIRGNRVAVASERVQAAADQGQHRMIRAAAIAARQVATAKRRGLRIAPAAAGELDAIINSAVENTVEQQRLAFGVLEPGEPT